MTFFRAAGFVLTVLGIAGMDGAIYFGTGYLASGALLAMGAAGLYADYRLSGRERKAGEAMTKVPRHKKERACKGRLSPKKLKKYIRAYYSTGKGKRKWKVSKSTNWR